MVALGNRKGFYTFKGVLQRHRHCKTPLNYKMYRVWGLRITGILVKDLAEVLVRVERGSATTKGSDGYNLVQNFSDTVFASPLKRSLSGVSANTFPNMGVDSTLRDNGGPTRTYALLPGSPAIDQIPRAACHPKGISTDQRSVKRPQDPPAI